MTRPDTPGTRVPYVPAEIIGGHLVRVCPECQQQIGERTDDQGLVSDHFTAHYEAEHREQEPARQRVYILGHPRFPQLDYQALKHARKVIGDEADMTVVRAAEFMEIPEGEPVLHAGEIIVAGFADDSADRDIRWYIREGDDIVFQPTERQADRLHASHQRLSELFDEVKADAERIGPREVHTALLDWILAEMKLQTAYFKAGRWKATKAAATIANIETRRLDVNQRIEHVTQGLCAAKTRAGKLCSRRATESGHCRLHAGTVDPGRNDQVAA